MRDGGLPLYTPPPFRGERRLEGSSLVSIGERERGVGMGRCTGDCSGDCVCGKGVDCLAGNSNEGRIVGPPRQTRHGVREPIPSTGTVPESYRRPMREYVRDYYLETGLPCPMRMVSRRYATKFLRRGQDIHAVVLDECEHGRLVLREHYESGKRVVWVREVWETLTEAERSGPVGMGLERRGERRTGKAADDFFRDRETSE